MVDALLWLLRRLLGLPMSFLRPLRSSYLMERRNLSLAYFFKKLVSRTTATCPGAGLIVETSPHTFSNCSMVLRGRTPQGKRPVVLW